VVRELGRLDDSRALHLLYDGFLGQRVSIRRAIIQALPRGDERTLDHLALGTCDGDDRVRRAAVKALAQLPPHPERLALLIHALSDERQDICLLAVQALEGIHVRQATDALLAALPMQSPKVQQEIAMVLGRRGEPASLEGLAALFEQPGASCRFLVEGISRFRTARAAEILLTRLADRREAVRLAVVQALGHVRQPHAVPALAERVWKDQSITVRQQAANSLGQLGGAAAAQALLKVARQAEYQNVRQAAVQALVEMDSPIAAVPLLVLAQYGEAAGVRSDVTRAYQTLAQRWPLEILLLVGGESAEPFRSHLRWFLDGLDEARPESERLLWWLAQES
jgi:HEAT repeat protein